MLLKKISLGKCLLSKLLKLNRGCLGSRSYIFLKLVIFRTKQKSSKANLWVNDLMLKILQKAMYFDSPNQAKSRNLTPKWKILNVFWTWLEVKGGICLVSSPISKILFFQMALKTCEMWSKWNLNIHFFPKTYKKSPSGWVLRPQTPIASGSWWFRPQAPSDTRLSCTNLLTTSPNFDNIIINLFTVSCSFSLFSLTNPGYVLKQTLSFWSFIFCPIKSLSFWKFLMTSLM